MNESDLREAHISATDSAEGLSAALHSRSELEEMGAHGERRTDELLKPLAKAGYVLLRDVAIPGTLDVVDHLVIGPTGLFVVGSACWRTDELVWAHEGQLFEGPHYRGDEIDRLCWLRSKVVTKAGLDRFPAFAVEAVMCIFSAPFTHEVLEVNGALAVRPRALTYAILRPASHHPPEVVKAVATIVMNALPRPSGGPWPRLP